MIFLFILFLFFSYNNPQPIIGDLNDEENEKIIIDVDEIAPILNLSEKESSMYIYQEYKEISFTAIDDLDGDISEKVQVDFSNVDFNNPGTYLIKYMVSDNSGNKTISERTLIIKERPTDKVIYLTFDDGPYNYTEELLDILDKYNVKATFFVLNNPKYNHLIKKIYDKGHSIGIHGLTHNYKEIYSSKEAFYEDLYAMRDIIKEQIGVEVDIIRFPGGSSNTVSKKYKKGIMTELTNDVLNKGFQYYDWNVTSEDVGNAKTSEKVYNNVIEGIKERKISVVLQHDVREHSVKAVEDIIIWGLENGYTFLPLDKYSCEVHHKVCN